MIKKILSGECVDVKYSTPQRLERKAILDSNRQRWAFVPHEREALEDRLLVAHVICTEKGENWTYYIKARYHTKIDLFR